MSLLFVVVYAAVMYVCVFSISTIFVAHYAFGDHFARREEDINVEDKVSDHIVSNNCNLADDEYESDDEEDGYMSSSSHLSEMESCSHLHEDTDQSQSMPSTPEDTSYCETELSETDQDTESDNNTCDLKHENIHGPIDDELNIVTSLLC